MSRAWFPDYGTGKKEEFPGLVNIRRKTQGLIQGEEASSWLSHVRAHTHRSAGTRVCAPFPALPLPWWAGRVGATSPQGNQLLKDLIWHFYIQLTACNIPFKKIYYLFACLKRHKDNIHVCDPDCLWSRGREIVQTVLPSSTPGMPAREQSCCPRGEGQIPWPSANTVSSPSGDYWGGERHRGLGLNSPTPVLLTYTVKTSVPLNLGKEYFFFFREPYPQITCLSISSLSLLTSKFLHHHPLSASTKTFISVFYVVVTCPCGLKIF